MTPYHPLHCPKIATIAMQVDMVGMCICVCVCVEHVPFTVAINVAYVFRHFSGMSVSGGCTV